MIPNNPLKLTLSLPPSKNRLHIIARNRLIKSGEYRVYENTVFQEIQLQSAKYPQFKPTIGQKVVMEYTVWLKDQRRDASNIQDILLDVLTKGQVWDDDKWVMPRLMGIGIDSAMPRVEVEIYDAT